MEGQFTDWKTCQSLKPPETQAAGIGQSHCLAPLLWGQGVEQKVVGVAEAGLLGDHLGCGCKQR